MKHYNTTFFCDKGEAPRATLSAKPDRGPWPIVFRVTSDYETASVIFHLRNESDFISFKNSVIEMYDAYRKIMGYKR